MKKTLTLSLLLIAAASLAFAHAGEVHTYMGTITTLQKDGGFTMTTTGDRTVHVQLAKTTSLLHADGQSANAAELQAGSRVVVKMSKDGRTALSVKIGAARERK